MWLLWTVRKDQARMEMNDLTSTQLGIRVQVPSLLGSIIIIIF